MESKQIEKIIEVVNLLNEALKTDNFSIVALALWKLEKVTQRYLKEVSEELEHVIDDCLLSVENKRFIFNNLRCGVNDLLAALGSLAEALIDEDWRSVHSAVISLDNFMQWSNTPLQIPQEYFSVTQQFFDAYNEKSGGNKDK